MAVDITMPVPKMGDCWRNELESRPVSVRADPFSVLENHTGNFCYPKLLRNPAKKKKKSL